MRYKVWFNNGREYAVCYGKDTVEAANAFGDYHPTTAITAITEYRDPTEPAAELSQLIEGVNPDKVIDDLIAAIAEAGVAHRVAGYLARHGYGTRDELEE